MVAWIALGVAVFACILLVGLSQQLGGIYRLLAAKRLDADTREVLDRIEENTRDLPKVAPHWMRDL